MSGKAKNVEVLNKTKILAKEAGKGVVEELGKISKGVLSEFLKIATLQKD